ncbi:MAG TPA: ferritin-like domain-containing protein [Bryobacteraceae bacterium]|jgi:ferritin-like metal-binding protein YciE|nr:ferritin-like domain-containing protein [Bryobacteraceae bacterium]
MSLFNNIELNSFQDLFISQLEDLYDAELRLTEALPKIADAATSPELKQAIQSHLRETQAQASRLEGIFSKLGKQPKRQTCEAMKGLISEGSDVISAKGDPAVKDAALIAACQRVEHYEISGYGTARTFAARLGMQDVAQTLQQTLQEEANADEKLNRIAESQVNVRAAVHA